jgi:hypothetical protein
MTHFEPQPHPLPDAPLTMVELTWVEQKIEHWIKFGRPVHDQVTDASHRTLGFAPGTIFAPVRWASNDFGTVFSRIEVLRAPAAGDTFTTIPFVQPGAQILLRVSSWPKVGRVLEAIEKIEAHPIIGVISAIALPPARSRAAIRVRATWLGLSAGASSHEPLRISHGDVSDDSLGRHHRLLSSPPAYHLERQRQCPHRALSVAAA